jgi:hypothetical protein
MSETGDFKRFTENETVAAVSGFVVCMGAAGLEWANLSQPLFNPGSQAAPAPSAGLEKQPEYGTDAALFLGLPALGAFVFAAATSKVRHMLYNHHQRNVVATQEATEQQIAVLDSWYDQPAYDKQSRGLGR